MWSPPIFFSTNGPTRRTHLPADDLAALHSFCAVVLGPIRVGVVSGGTNLRWGGEDAVCSANELFDTWKIHSPSLRSFSQMPCSIQWRRRMPVVRAKFDPSSLPLGVYIGYNCKKRDMSPADLPHQRWSMVGKRLIFLRSIGALFFGPVHRFFCV